MLVTKVINLTFQNVQPIVVSRLAKQLSAFKEVLSSTDLLRYVALLGRSLACSDTLSVLGCCTYFPFYATLYTPSDDF